MEVDAPASLFIIGRDYHLGDLLWLTAVLSEYRRQRHPARLALSVPDRGISRILEHNPHIDHLIYRHTDAGRVIRRPRERDVIVHDLRAIPIGLDMVRQWRRRLPWLYYRDLWLAPRGQWLATYLGLGRLLSNRPTVCLTETDRARAGHLSHPYVVLAPHIGQYRIRPAGAVWRRIKGWDWQNWIDLAAELRRSGVEPVTLAAAGQRPVPGTESALGLPIRQAAAVIEGAAGLIGGESGLWFIAAALKIPFVIVPWWLPSAVDWAEPMGVPHRLIRRQRAQVNTVLRAWKEISVA